MDKETLLHYKEKLEAIEGREVSLLEVAEFLQGYQDHLAEECEEHA